MSGSWNINIQLFIIFSYQLPINVIFRATPDYATCHLNLSYDIIEA